MQVAAFQALRAQALSDQQIQAQKDIADQQAALNQQQFQAQQDQYAQQQGQVNSQSDRQTQYDTGRAQLLDQGTKQINDAFSQFSPDYFNQYAKNYMASSQDQIDYQKAQAQKQLNFGLARQGISSSQAGIDQTGVLQETAGRAAAQQTTSGQSAAV
jgi:hypothetical protein